VNLSPSDFEKEVGWVFARLFPVKPQLVGGIGDGGIDLNLYDTSGTLVGIVQAKRYGANKTLKPSFLRELDSCKRRLGVRRAFLVTTAQFSAETRQQAKDMGIDLVDGKLFEEWRAKAGKTKTKTQPGEDGN
jgi:restriction endonuclease Mrr